MRLPLVAGASIVGVGGFDVDVVVVVVIFLIGTTFYIGENTLVFDTSSSPMIAPIFLVIFLFL